MGFFKKLGSITRANLNNLLNQLEDPKKMANQAVMDLEESKQKALALLVKAQANIKLLEQKMLKLRDNAGQLLVLAEQALKKADDQEARLVLEKKQFITEEKQFCETELKEEQKTVLTIKAGLRALDEKINELKLSAKNIAADTINKTDAFDNFARMEEKIEMSEYEITALNELLDLDASPKKDAEKPASFDKHSDPQALETELMALKKKLNS